MKLNKIFAGAFVALLGLPTAADAQNDPLIINGSLIDWYYYGRDHVDSSSKIDWYQQPVGGGAWIDEQGVAHSTGESNIGLFSLVLPGTNRPFDLGYVIRNHVLYSNCGGVYVGNNTYYSFFGHESDYESGMDGEYGSEDYEILVRKWTWDIDENDNCVNVKYQNVGKLAGQPTDLCYDPVYDKVYGVFNTGSGAYKLGELDVETFKVRYISREAMSYYGELRCLAIDSKSQLFGIDASGWVYKVSKEDGTLTEIGNVGFKSQHRMMSATIDLRTDKMYWLGYMNDGKNSASTDGTNTTATVAEGGRDTGLYEVNTETGEATLIGKTDFVDIDMTDPMDPKVNKYGKLQMTGIYVEGSFTRKNYDQLITLTSFPSQLRKGETGTIEVKVKNIGMKDVRGRDYQVNCYVDGQLIGTIDFNGEDIYTTDMAAGTSVNYAFSYTATRAGQLSVYAEIVNAKDEEVRNNKTDEQEILVLNDQLLPEVKLEGDVARTGIKLVWSDPQGRLVDGAEDYAAFSYKNLGEWTMVDGDKGYTQKPNNFNESIDYPNWSTPKAYIVFDPVKAGFDLAVGGEKFNPYAGKQYFAAFYTAVPDDSEAGGHQIPKNDWMISPELSGLAQTISFMAKGYKGTVATGYETEVDYHEKMRVLYSTEGTDTTTFVVAVDTFVVENTEWTRYEASLPAGAKHFALQCVSDDGFVLMIDNVEFQIQPLQVMGYKVYCNGKLVAELGADVTSYADVRAQATDLYTVVAVYENGESNPSNGISLEMMGGGGTVGIAKTVQDNREATEVFNLRGQRVSSMSTPGIYVVKTGSMVRKLIKK